jgi:hypothetical protein
MREAVDEQGYLLYEACGKAHEEGYVLSPLEVHQYLQEIARTVV